MSVLNWVQTIGKHYQQMTKVAAIREGVKGIHVVTFFQDALTTEIFHFMSKEAEHSQNLLSVSIEYLVLRATFFVQLLNGG